MYLKEKLIWNIDYETNRYPAEIKKVLFKKHISLRKKYTNWIGRISKKYHNDIDWWVSVPVSRNPYFSKIFQTICILETLKTLRNFKIDIISNSKALVNILEKNFKNKNINIFYTEEKKKNKSWLYYLVGYFIMVTLFAIATIVVLSIIFFGSAWLIDRIFDATLSLSLTHYIDKIFISGPVWLTCFKFWLLGIPLAYWGIRKDMLKKNK